MKILKKISLLSITFMSAICAHNAVQAATVAPGYDLLYTLPGTEYNFGGFAGVQSFSGVPLGTFDFGGTTGIQNVGETDTILYRTEAATSSDGLIDIEMVALSLRSDNVFSLDGVSPAEYWTVNLLQDTGSTMNISFNAAGTGGTFDSNLNFLVEFVGETSNVSTGPIAVNMSQTDSTWGRDPLNNNILIPGINYHLNGFDNSEDFFTGIAMHGPQHTHKTIDINGVPEPSTYITFGAASVFLFFMARRKRS